MLNIKEELVSMSEEKYAEFQSNLMPTIRRETILGVRVPNVKELAKRLQKEPETCENFLHSLPHETYEENMLHSVLLTKKKDYVSAVRMVDAFLPYVDNWAVCDTLKPVCFGKNKDKLIEEIKRWTMSKEIYTSRFGIEMLMNFYLDADFKKEYLSIPASVRSDEYYVKMMLAWFFATALAKQWEDTLPYIERKCLPVWVHNKSIQKAIESYRITPEQKDYLRTLKISN